MERNNISRCLGGLRLEDQGERRLQTFLVDNFSSLIQPRRKQDRSVRFLVSFGGFGGGEDYALLSEFWIHVQKAV